MVNKLQRNLIEYVSKTLDHRFCTERADFSAARLGVLAAYKAAKLPKPKAILKVGSPMAGAMLQVALTRAMNYKFTTSLANTSIYQSVRRSYNNLTISEQQLVLTLVKHTDQLAWSIIDQKHEASLDVADAIRQEVELGILREPRSVKSSKMFKDYVLTPLRSGLIGFVDKTNPVIAAKLDVEVKNLSSAIPDKSISTHKIYRAASHNIMFNHELTFGNLLAIKFLAEMPNSKMSDAVQPVMAGITVCDNIGCVYYHRLFAILCDRPTCLIFNEERKLHNESGPAIEYTDGWKLWYLDGIRVDKQLVLYPEQQTITQINAELNSDVRALRIQRYGWPRYLKQINAKCVDTRTNDIEGTIEALYEDRRGSFGSRRLITTCPTGRVFAMGVPSEIETCEQAQNWLAGDKPFRVLGRT